MLFHKGFIIDIAFCHIGYEEKEQSKQVNTSQVETVKWKESALFEDKIYTFLGVKGKLSLIYDKDVQSLIVNREQKYI